MNDESRNVGKFDKPILFFHIPKTAGTSLIVALKNLYGDNAIARITETSVEKKELARLILRESTSHQVTIGHFPVQASPFPSEDYRYLTFLRRPVHRVVSLYKFLRGFGKDTAARLGLAAGFSLDELLESRNPELVSQTHDGMTRFLCGDPSLLDPNSDRFWLSDFSTAAEQASENLLAMHFGIVEEMSVSRQILSSELGVPLLIQAYEENKSSPLDVSEGELSKIENANRSDNLLYRRAYDLLKSRRDDGNAAGLDHHAIFRPDLSVKYVMGDVPGRQGFYETEHDGLCWLKNGDGAKIFANLDCLSCSILFDAYVATADYPLEDTYISMDSRRVKVDASRIGERWFRLTAAVCLEKPGAHVIHIRPPFFINPRVGGAEVRSLAFALHSVMIVGDPS